MAVWSLFCFNCYIHHSALVLRKGDGTANIIHIREGVTQGELLDMVACDIGVLLIIKLTKLAYPVITQPLYTENAWALGTLDNLESYFNSLKRNRPVRGY